MEQTTPPPSTPQPPPEVQQQPPPPSPSPPPPTTTNVSSAALPPPTTSSVPLPPASTSPQPSLPPPTQNPHHATSTPQSQTTPQVRTAAFNRPWQQQLQQQQPSTPSNFSHYPLSAVPHPAHSSSSTANSTSSSLPLLPPSQRGGMAIGVPASAHHPGASPPTPPSSFPSHNPPSFGQPFGGGMDRNVPDSVPTSNTPQPMLGAMGSSPAVRPPTGGPAHQLRPVQSASRPLSNPNTQTSGTQSFQGHGKLRVSAIGSPGAPLPGNSQSPHPQNQPWLSASSQVRPPLPSTSLGPQVSPQSMQQRSHIPTQQHNAVNATPQQQTVSSAPQTQHPSTLGPQEHHGQQLQQSRIQKSLPIQQRITRSPSLGTQSATQATIPSDAVQYSLPARAANAEPEELCNRILRKRTIQELVTQFGPSEKLAPEVEDILVDITEDFVESITSFGCSLAKHRKSTTLEAKDILLHLERNCNVTLPGFSGDEIMTYRKPFTSDIHRERLAMIKKSILAGEMLNSKSSAGQAGGNPRGHVAKVPNSLLGSPPTKVREAA